MVWLVRVRPAGPLAPRSETGICRGGMAGRYTGSYLDRSNGWRAVATLADLGQASLVGRIPKFNYDSASTEATKGAPIDVAKPRSRCPSQSRARYSGRHLHTPAHRGPPPFEYRTSPHATGRSPHDPRCLPRPKVLLQFVLLVKSSGAYCLYPIGQ